MLDRSRLPSASEFYTQHEALTLVGRGEWRTADCPFHGGRSLGVNVETGGWYCRNPSCGRHGGDILSFYMARHEVGFVQAAKDLGAWVDDAGHASEPRNCHGKAVALPLATRKHTSLSDYGHELWRACTGLPGTAGEAYLAARCCALPPADGDLRFHPALKHPSGYVGPALVALVTHAAKREPLTLHRTWIKPDGTKAGADPPRLLLGGHQKQGGVVRLWPDEAVSTGLGIAEGIETSLALSIAFRPVWSCLDAGNLAAFPVLPGVECLTIAADNDDAGRRAADECAARWHAAGREVRIVMAPTEGGDLNDLAQEMAA